MTTAPRIAAKPDAHVFLFRHGQSMANLNEHLIGGRTNESELTLRGMQQAKKLGKFIVDTLPQPDRAYSSQAVRAYNTGAIAMAEAGLVTAPIIDVRLQELSQGVWTGQNRAEIYTPETLTEIMHQGKDFKPQGGESMNEVGMRMYYALEAIADFETAGTQKIPTIYVFSHGLAIRCLASYIDDWSHKQTYQTEVPNASVSHMARVNGRWTVNYIGLDTQG